MWKAKNLRFSKTYDMIIVTDTIHLVVLMSRAEHHCCKSLDMRLVLIKRSRAVHGRSTVRIPRSTEFFKEKSLKISKFTNACKNWGWLWNGEFAQIARARKIKRMFKDQTNMWKITICRQKSIFCLWQNKLHSMSSKILHAEPSTGKSYCSDNFSVQKRGT